MDTYIGVKRMSDFILIRIVTHRIWKGRINRSFGHEKNNGKGPLRGENYFLLAKRM